MKILSPSISLVAFERRGELLKIFLNWHYCLIPLLINHGQLLYWRTFAARTISEYYLSGSGPTWSLSSWRIIPWDKSLWLPRGFASLRVYSSVFIRGENKRWEKRFSISVSTYSRKAQPPRRPVFLPLTHGCGGFSTARWSQAQPPGPAWVQILALPLGSRVSLGKLGNLSGPQASPLFSYA